MPTGLLEQPDLRLGLELGQPIELEAKQLDRGPHHLGQLLEPLAPRALLEADVPPAGELLDVAHRRPAVGLDQVLAHPLARRAQYADPT